ncbi:MAG: hypothetical protein WBG37_12665 [Desulfobacterales bacterium]
MKWKFWSKNNTDKVTQLEIPKKLSKPKEIPEMVGRYLVVNLKEDPDWVWSLKAVIRPKESVPDAFRVRLFDPARATAYAVRVLDYTSLDAHPHLILYEGWYNKKTQVVQIAYLEQKEAV